MKTRVRLVVGLAVVGLIAISQIADAIHPRPKGASPLRVALVPAYDECTAPNRTHGPPLGFQSCTPPTQTSQHVSVGTPDANGAGARSIGFLEIVVPSPSNGRITITSSISDVRCLPGTSAAVCGSANAADGPDYSGELQANTTIRVSDHVNGPDLNEAATMVDIPFPINLQCSNTPDTAVGGVCTVPPGPLVQPALYPETSSMPRAVVDTSQIQVFDGGPDGQVSTQDNTRFEVQGLFVP
jgi:hypothetical protein